MTKIFSKNSNDFYDDYAHHPTEISSILDGVKNVYNDRKIISVFEPHRYSRVLSLKMSLQNLLKNQTLFFYVLYMLREKKFKIQYV